MWDSGCTNNPALNWADTLTLSTSRSSSRSKCRLRQRWRCNRELTTLCRCGWTLYRCRKINRRCWGYGNWARCDSPVIWLSILKESQ